MKFHNNILLEENKIMAYDNYTKEISKKIINKKLKIKDIKISNYSDLNEEIIKLGEKVKNKNGELKILRDTLLYEENITANEKSNYERLKSEFLDLEKQFEQKRMILMERYNSIKMSILSNKKTLIELKQELREIFIKLQTKDIDPTLIKDYKSEYFSKKKLINKTHKVLRDKIEKLNDPIFYLVKINNL